MAATASTTRHTTSLPAALFLLLLPLFEVCGAAFNLGISEIPGMVNMWGIYTTSKEANMYPKPIQDLSGWSVRSIACSTKVRPQKIASLVRLAGKAS